MTVGNPYVSRARTYRREAEAEGTGRGVGTEDLLAPGEYRWSMRLPARPGLSLDPDLLKALIKAEEMELIVSGLPGLDCGSCGSPSCRALAEDIVRGEATITDCIFKLRENVRKLAGELMALEAIQPPGLDREGAKQDSGAAGAQ